MQFPRVLIGSNKNVTPQELLLLKIYQKYKHCYSTLSWTKTLDMVIICPNCYSKSIKCDCKGV